MVLPTLLPFVLVFFWHIMQTVQVYRHEWQLGGIYQTLTIPQPGWKIALAKLTAVMLGFVLNTILAAVGFLLTVWRAGFRELAFTYVNSLIQAITLAEFIKTTSVFALGYLMLGINIAVVIHASYNCMRLTSRFRFLLGISLFTVGWLQSLFASAGYHIFRWVPHFAIKVPFGDPLNIPQTVNVIFNSSIILGYILALALTFWLTGYLIENVLEV